MLQDALKSSFGHETFLPSQERVIENVLARRHSLVLMSTGSGKSLCYQLPAVCLEGLALVVSPLVALMKDQVDSLNAHGISAGCINSSIPYTQIRQTMIKAGQGQLDILYVAPERLALAGFRKFLKAQNLCLIAIDEAHCISEWGHDFRPDYRNLKSLRDDFPEVPVIALTATATVKVRQDIVNQMRIPNAVHFVASFNRPNLTYEVRPKRRAFQSLTQLLDKHSGGSAIIYRFSRKDTEDLAARLSANGFKALPYHAGLEDDLRRETQERFLRGDVPIIVATIAFGMGIDKHNVRLVVHYDLPKSIEGYYQEAGRAGRDGMPSDCVLFYSIGDKSKQEYFLQKIEDDGFRETATEHLSRMVEYCEIKKCRRAMLLKYFGEEWTSENCGACDACMPQSRREESSTRYDGTEIAQKVLSAVIRTGERFGVSHVAAVLKGSRSARVINFRHDKLSVHGIVKELSTDELKEVIDQLLDKELLARSTGDYPTLYVTPKGRRFLKNRESLTLTRVANQQQARPDSEFQPNAKLMSELRAFRLELAQCRNVPAFVIFTDRTLRDLSMQLPQDLVALRGIFGMGEAKVDDFGSELIAAIKEHTQSEANSSGTNTPPPAKTRSQAKLRAC